MSLETAVFLGHNALGDTLCTTPSLRAFRRAHPNTRIFYITQNSGFCRILEHNPDIDLVIYSDHMWMKGVSEVDQNWLRALPVDYRGGPANLYRLDMRAFVTTHEAFQQHISQGFAKMFDLELDSVKPTVVLTEYDRRALKLFDRGRPYILFSMHSVSNPDRKDGNGKAKNWPAANWEELARRIHSWDCFDVIAIGAEGDPRPTDLPNVRALYGLPIRTTAALIENAACLVTVENGIAHLAAAFDPPVVELYSDIVPLAWAKPAASKNCRILYGDPHTFDVDQVASLVEQHVMATAS